MSEYSNVNLCLATTCCTKFLFLISLLISFHIFSSNVNVAIINWKVKGRGNLSINSM
jgi:hypothetical protein